MSPEEQEVTLVVQGGNLTTAELGHWGEELCPHATDGVTEQCGEAVEDELGCEELATCDGIYCVARTRVGGGTAMSVDLRTKLDTAELEVGCWPRGEVDESESVCGQRLLRAMQDRATYWASCGPRLRR